MQNKPSTGSAPGTAPNTVNPTLNPNSVQSPSSLTPTAKQDTNTPAVVKVNE